MIWEPREGVSWPFVVVSIILIVFGRTKRLIFVVSFAKNPSRAAKSKENWSVRGMKMPRFEVSATGLSLGF